MERKEAWLLRCISYRNQSLSTCLPKHVALKYRPLEGRTAGLSPERNKARDREVQKNQEGAVQKKGGRLCAPARGRYTASSRDRLDRTVLLSCVLAKKKEKCTTISSFCPKPCP